MDSSGKVKRPGARVLDQLLARADSPKAPEPFPPVVEFRRRGLKDDFVAFPYGQLIWLHFSPSYGVIAHFSSHTVHIKGLSLEAVYRSLRDRTLRSVSVDTDLELPEDAPAVTGIFVLPKSKTDPGFAPLDDGDLEERDG